MKIVICGAGVAGTYLANYFSRRKCDITIIEKDPKIAKDLNERMDVHLIIGNVAYPETLERANVENADCFIALSSSDELNILCCRLVSALFAVHHTIAHIGHTEYFSQRWGEIFSRDILSVGTTLSTETIIAKNIAEKIRYHGVNDFCSMMQGKVAMVSFICSSEMFFYNRTLDYFYNYYPQIKPRLVAIVRQNKLFIPELDSIIKEGDYCYFLCLSEQIQDLSHILYYVPVEKNRIIVAGASKVGLRLCQELSKFKDKQIFLLEEQIAQSEEASRLLPKVTIIRSNIFDHHKDEYDIFKTAHASIAVTDNDNTNLITSMWFSHKGVNRTLTMVRDPSLDFICGNIKNNILISPMEIILSEIVSALFRKKLKKVYVIQNGNAEFIEGIIPSRASIIGQNIYSLGKYVEYIRLGFIIKKDGSGSPQLIESDYVFHEGDHITLLSQEKAIPIVHQAFFTPNI